METETWAGAGTNDAHSGTWWLNLVLHQRHSRRPCRLPWGGGGGGVRNWGCPCLSPAGKEDRKGLTAPALEQWKQWEILFSWAPDSLQMVTASMKLKDAYSLEGRL